MSLSLDENLSPFSLPEQTDNNSEEKNISQIIEEINSIIKSLKIIIPNNLDLEIKEKINCYLSQMTNLLNIITNIINSNIIQNETLQRKEEQCIRNLYGKYFNQKLINEVLENKINALNKKEKEYELLKQKTGAIICNGKVICNERKDNEIIILRTENSLLKSAIKKTEDLLKEKNEMINVLNNDILLYKGQIDELMKTKQENFSSFSNINININESKKDYNQKNNNNSYINSYKVYTSKNNNNKENKKPNNNINNRNDLNNNIYSSYQKNSLLINKVNNIKNKKIISNKEALLQNNNKIENNIDSNRTFSIKYISVNKSLFSPKNNKKQKIEFNSSNNNDKKESQINRIKKKKYILNTNLVDKEYKTIEKERTTDKELKNKKILLNDRIIFSHRKANSIQYPDISIKKLIKGKKDKNLSIEKDNNCKMHSEIRKLSKGKNQTLNINHSLPSSIITTIADGFMKNKGDCSQKCLTYFLMPYGDRTSDNKGRNKKNFKINSDYFKDNSLFFFQKTFLNRTNCENYTNSKNNSLNMIYNNSVELCRNINPNFKKII